ncbi:MAG TPA: HEAT repeat domain-containing protein [bacterium]|nr:HEAT repeat domain-containing protein [bacterium]
MNLLYALSPEDLMRTDTLVFNKERISRSIKTRRGGEVEISFLGGEWKSFAFEAPWKENGPDREKILAWLKNKDLEKQSAAYILLSFAPFLPAVKHLAGGIKNSNIWIRWDSLIAFEKLRDLKNADYILPLFSDISPTLREKALLVAGEMKYDKARNAILSMIWDENERVRAAALYSLFQIFRQDPVVLNACREALGDARTEVRFTASRILGEFPSSEVIKDMGKILIADPDTAIRYWIAETFEKWKEPESVKYLIQGLKDKDEKVREKCKTTLDSIQKRSDLPL